MRAGATALVRIESGGFAVTGDPPALEGFAATPAADEAARTALPAPH